MCLRTSLYKLIASCRAWGKSAPMAVRMSVFQRGIATLLRGFSS